MDRRRLINYAAFVALMVSTGLGIGSLWGLLFLFWTIPNFYSGRAFLVFDVLRDEDPILFWAIQLAWVVLGTVMVLSDFLPGWS